jgi:hypothetical protein
VVLRLAALEGLLNPMTGEILPVEVRPGLGGIVASCRRSSTLHQVHCHVRRLGL